MISGRAILAWTWQSLAGRWTPVLLAVWAALICQGIPTALPMAGPLLALLLSGPFYVGISAYILGVVRKKDPDWELLLQGFEKPIQAALAFLMVLGWLILGTLLFIVPGVLWLLSYSQTFFILAEHPEFSAGQAMRESKRLMANHRMDLVRLHLWQSGMV